MVPEKLLCKIVKILEKLNIPYIVTGGYAVAVLAKPRFTADIDIVIELLPQKISLLSKELFSIDRDVYVSEKAIEEALEQKGEFNFIHPQTGLKVDFWIKKYPFERFEKAIVVRVGKQDVKFISPEDLILSKLIWYKERQGAKQLEDVSAILEISRPDLDYIKEWAIKQTTIEILNKILKK